MEIKIAGGIMDMIQTLKSEFNRRSGGCSSRRLLRGVQDGYAQYAPELDINSSSLKLAAERSLRHKQKDARSAGGYT